MLSAVNWLQYLPAAHARWLADETAENHAVVEGALVFADVSGFTQLSERLAQKGKAGGEELTDLVNGVVSGLLDASIPLGGDLIKFGGDALLLLFTGDDHSARAAAAGAAMQKTMRRFRELKTESGRVTLKMSVGAEAGQFQMFLVGSDFRELIVAGPTVSRVAALESAADPGEVLVGPALAGALAPECLGSPKAGGVLLRRPPSVEQSAALDGFAISAERAMAGVPVALREHLGTAADGEHRQGVIAFVQFQGTDELLETAGPARLAEVLSEMITVTEEACRARGVTFLTTDLDSNAGKVLLVCGAPTTLGEDDDRMVAAVRTILDSNPGLPLRAGINRGRIFAAEVGTDTRRVYCITGDTVNLAARVMGKAPTGGCLATIPVVENLSTEYQLETVEPFQVKGKSEPISAALIGPVVGRRPGGIPAADTPLVGREAEREILLKAVSDARHGTTRVVEMVGEAGIGKSRLIAEMCAAAHDMLVMVVEGSQYASTTPYRAVRDAVRGLLGLAIYESDDIVVDRLAGVVRDVAPELEPWLPLLATPFGVRLPETPETAALAPSNRRARLHEVTTALLSALVPDTGLLVVEDAYWLDEASGELLSHVISRLHDRRHWAICIARRGIHTTLDLSAVSDVTTLDLGPLPSQAAAALLAGTGGALSPSDAQTLVERSGGNPLFLQELATATVRGASVDQLPGTVEALLAAHIDTLGPNERTLLRTASVLGARFARGLLAALTGEDDRTSAVQVRRLSGLLLTDGEERLRFRHNLLREAAYEGLSFKRRRALHARAAELIEERAAPNTEAAAEPLSLHYYAAGRHQDSWHWSRVAGDRARRSSAPIEAAAFYERALESARPAGVAAEAIAETNEILGDVCELGGQYDAAAAAYDRARKLVPDNAVAIGNLCRKEGWVSERSGRYSNALRWYTKAFRALESIAPSPEARRLRAELSLAYGAVRLRQGRHADAVPLLEKAVQEAADLDARPTLAHAYYDLDWAFTEMGRPDPHYRELALPIFEELGDWQGQGNTLNNLGLGAYYEGRWDEALESWERARDAFEKAGDVVQMATIANNLGEILSDQGHLHQAEGEFRTALETWTDAKFLVGVGLATSNLGRAAARAGRLDEARDLLASAIDQLWEIGATELALEAEARDAERCLLAGDHAGALTQAEAVRTRATRPVLVALVERTIGYAHAQRGELGAALDWLQRGFETAKSVGAAFELAQTREAIRHVQGLAGADVDADPLIAETLDRLGVIRIPEPPLAVLG